MKVPKPKTVVIKVRIHESLRKRMEPLVADSGNGEAYFIAGVISAAVRREEAAMIFETKLRELVGVQA